MKEADDLLKAIDKYFQDVTEGQLDEDFRKADWEFYSQVQVPLLDVKEEHGFGGHVCNLKIEAGLICNLKNPKTFNPIYQCDKCGKIFIDDATNIGEKNGKDERKCKGSENSECKG